MAGPSYQFFSWARRGIANEIAEADTLGQAGVATTALLRAQVDAALDIVGEKGGAIVATHTVARRLEVVGPADAGPLRADAVIRTEPQNAEPAFVASHLPYVEFYEEDFPWRYTPAKANGDRLRPWIQLWVLEPSELEREDGVGGAPARVKLKDPATVPADGSWAWAHVQVAIEPEDGAALDHSVTANPDACLSRLLCPRRLEAKKKYLAFVVPAFETGRRAALGEDVAGLASVPAQQAADPSKWHPVLYEFHFTTGDAGDFEDLARRIQPFAAGDGLAYREMDASTPGYGLDDVAPDVPVRLESALIPADYARPDSPPNDPVAQRLATILNATSGAASGSAPVHPLHASSGGSFPAGFVEDPIVLPPIYGGWHAGAVRVLDATNPAWVDELNTNLADRAAAGLGAAIVADKQEELMERAWQQVEGLEAINRRRREAEMSANVLLTIVAKHVQPTHESRRVALTSPVHKVVLGLSGKTVAEEIRGSVLPPAALSGAFKRAARKLGRDATGVPLARQLPAGFANGTLSAAPESTELADALEPAVASQALDAATKGLFEDPIGIARFLFARGVRASVVRELALHGSIAAMLVAVSASFAAWTATVQVDCAAELALRSAEIASTAQLHVQATLNALLGALRSITAGPTLEEVTVGLDRVVFDDVFQLTGPLDGKSYKGVVFAADGTAPLAPARMTTPVEVTQFAADYAAFRAGIFDQRPRIVAPRAIVLQDVDAAVVTATNPVLALAARVGRLTSVSAPAGRPFASTMAYPTFEDALFEELLRRGADHIVANVDSIAKDSATIVVPNKRFIAAVMAGANHAMACELLWREYPTSLAGTFFSNFWNLADSVDQGPDIDAMDQWVGRLGDACKRSADVIVLLLRSELLRKYPNTVVYAEKAVVQNGVFNLGGTQKLPVFRADVTSEVTALAFDLTKEQAVGVHDGGWFIVFKQRPGQTTFGCDAGEGVLPALGTWNDLDWRHIGTQPGGYLDLGANLVGMIDGTWAASASDMAYILYQAPFLCARHARDLIGP